MVNCILIADSGSTKTDWILLSKEYGMLEIHTAGINPVRDTQDAIFLVLQDQLVPQIPPTHHISKVFFYGAGCIDPFKQTIADAISNWFPQTAITIESDLLGAARALCGNQPGIACILGTGSNSCLYDGKDISQHVPPLGYIIGDEGSGAVLGKTLVGNLFKGIFPLSLQEAFTHQYGLTQADIINAVYRNPLPNRFLASLVPFIAEHREEEHIRDMLISSFQQFFFRNINAYRHPEMPVNFVGSIASIFREELTTAAHLEQFQIGKIIKSPAHDITLFHQAELQ